MNSTLFKAIECSLQIIMQARNLKEVYRLYNVLIAFGPMLLGLTISISVFKSLLVDIDI